MQKSGKKIVPLPKAGCSSVILTRFYTRAPLLAQNLKKTCT